jgi:micrococcal nuclease
MYEYGCKIIKVVDGDTVDIDIDLGFGVWLFGERVRLYGIDTPESRTSDKVEKIFGNLAKEYVQAAMPVGSRQVLMTHKYDAKGKFGRVLGDFKFREHTTLCNALIEAKHAVPYNAQNKDAVKDAHLENRNTLMEAGVVTVEMITKATT